MVLKSTSYKPNKLYPQLFKYVWMKCTVVKPARSFFHVDCFQHFYVSLGPPGVLGNKVFIFYWPVLQIDPFQFSQSRKHGWKSGWYVLIVSTYVWVDVMLLDQSCSRQTKCVLHCETDRWRMQGKHHFFFKWLQVKWPKLDKKKKKRERKSLC